jgi:hypothetical protein
MQYLLLLFLFVAKGSCLMIENDVALDLVMDADYQYKKTLNKGKNSVFNAIDDLIPELKRLESAYNKLNIVTKRLDKIRELDTLSVFATTHKINKKSKIEEEIVKLEILKNESDLLELMSVMSNIVRGDK